MCDDQPKLLLGLTMIVNHTVEASRSSKRNPMIILDELARLAKINQDLE